MLYTQISVPMELCQLAVTHSRCGEAVTVSDESAHLRDFGGVSC